MLASNIAGDLAAATHCRVPLQVCLRDIWRPHVLFQGAAVTGIVDFGAMDVDSVAGDVARLLGSMAGGAEAWQIGLAAYESIRPLGDDERSLVGAYDRSGVLLSALNWLRWLLVEGRTFPDESAVHGRLEELTERLTELP
jgi:homoserine kinase type II